MNYLSLKIKSWRLPRKMLLSFFAVFAFLSLFTLQEALNPEQIDPTETITLHGEISAMRRTFFKSSLLLTFDIDGYCSEFTVAGFRPFHYSQFKEDFAPAMTVDFSIRKADQEKLQSCGRCEIVALKSNNATYLTLSEHNNSSYTAKRIVAGGITGALATAGLICLLLGLLSTDENNRDEHYLERQSAFKRKFF